MLSKIKATVMAAIDRPDGSAVARAPTLAGGRISAREAGASRARLHYERPDTRVIATDIAPEAVALAKDNADESGLSDRVRIERGDLGSPVPAAAMGRLDSSRFPTPP